jgi:monovalent cation:H+ antiporter-2, CPA2 family
MPHEVELIATIAIGFALAFAFGFIAIRLGLPPLVGYLIAGVCIGPSTPGFVADREIAGQLAEIGVILLMFGVGLHFSVADLLAVRRIAVPGAIGQIIVATAIGVGMTTLWGWSFGAGLVLGLSLSVASTVVLLRALEERNAIETANGRIAIGWLIVEDLAWWSPWCSCRPSQKPSAGAQLMQLTPRPGTAWQLFSASPSPKLQLSSRFSC